MSSVIKGLKRIMMEPCEQNIWRTASARIMIYFSPFISWKRGITLQQRPTKIFFYMGLVSFLTCLFYIPSHNLYFHACSISYFHDSISNGSWLYASEMVRWMNKPKPMKTPTWIRGRERTATAIISWPIATEVMSFGWDLNMWRTLDRSHMGQVMWKHVLCHMRTTKV